MQVRCYTRCFSVSKKRILLVSAFAFVAFRAEPLRAAEAADIEARLRQLETRLDQLQRENRELRLRLGDDGARTAVPVSPGGKESKLIVGGFLQGQAEFGGAADARFAGTRDRFYFRRARIHLAGAFAEQHLEFKIEGEFGANSLSAGTGLRAQANEIYAGWNRFAAASVRFGQLKPAYGAEQLASDGKLLTAERSLANDRLTDGRQPGVAVFGELLERRLGYMVMSGNGNGSNSSANDNSKFLHSARLYGMPISGPEAGRLLFGASARYSEDRGVSRPGLGLSSTTSGAVDNLFSGHRDGWAADAQWQRGPLDLSAEFLRVRYRPDNDIPAGDFSAEGWHATLAYFVVPDQLQAVVRHESFDPNTTVGDDTSRTWTLGANYYLRGDDLKVMVNYLFGDTPDTPNDEGRLILRLHMAY